MFQSFLHVKKDEGGKNIVCRGASSFSTLGDQRGSAFLVFPLHIHLLDVFLCQHPLGIGSKASLWAPAENVPGSALRWKKREVLPCLINRIISRTRTCCIAKKIHVWKFITRKKKKRIQAPLKTIKHIFEGKFQTFLCKGIMVSVI